MNRRLLVALIPSLIVGTLFYPFIKSLFASSITVVVSLFVGGIIILIIESVLTKRGEKYIAVQEVDDVSLKQAFYIGLFQVFSVIPGVSRAGATIMGGLILGLRRKAIVEFSFLLAVPTMIAATAKDFYESEAVILEANQMILGLGFVTAYLVALLAMKLFLQYVQTNTFKPFGWYRIIISLLFFIFVIL